MPTTPRPAAAPTAALLLAAGLLLSACASTGGNAGRARQNLITREEVTASAATNAHELIQRLRPRWLQVSNRISVNTPVAIVVFQDDLNMGGLDALQRIPIEIVQSIRLLSAAEAGTLPGIGSQHVEHAIIVQTRRETRMQP